MTEENSNPESNAAAGESAEKQASGQSAQPAPPLVLVPPPAAEAKQPKTAARTKRPEEAPEESPFSVTVGRVYDGPLDLLLDLIRKQ
ncbi:MAG TPA: chromosome segregation protein ScpA, partial [Terracidiphilus sp.]|nr:chromosome segregation protein ScpA [Terracidiphilus sp.]